MCRAPSSAAHPCRSYATPQICCNPFGARFLFPYAPHNISFCFLDNIPIIATEERVVMDMVTVVMLLICPWILRREGGRS